METQRNMKTIPKNRAQAFLERVTEAQSYTLDNYFRGEPISDLARMRDLAQRLGGKVKADEASKSGQIHYHSNHWVEFRFL